MNSCTKAGDYDWFCVFMDGRVWWTLISIKLVLDELLVMCQLYRWISLSTWIPKPCNLKCFLSHISISSWKEKIGTNCSSCCLPGLHHNNWVVYQKIMALFAYNPMFASVTTYCHVATSLWPRDCPNQVLLHHFSYIAMLSKYPQLQFIMVVTNVLQ